MKNIKKDRKRQIYKRYADVYAGENDQKNISFYSFCKMCEDYNLFIS